MGGKSRSTNDWRRMLFSANRDWNPDYRQLSRDDFVEHRMEQRQMLVRFVTQGSHSLPVCSRPEAQAVVDFALASREDVLALSTVCREWSLACRVWLWSELSEPLWRRVCESLCPRTGRTHPELASKSMLLGWLRLPMAVGTLAGWLSQERYDNICLSRDGLCSTRFELAHSLATLFGFMANAGEASRFHRWRAPRYVGWSRLHFEPYLSGMALVDADDTSVARVCESLRDFSQWLLKNDNEAGRVVGAAAGPARRANGRGVRLDGRGATR